MLRGIYYIDARSEIISPISTYFIICCKRVLQNHTLLLLWYQLYDRIRIDLTFWHFTVIYFDPSFNYIQLSLVTRSVLVNKHIKSRGLSKSRGLECVLRYSRLECRYLVINTFNRWPTLFSKQYNYSTLWNKLTC